VRTVLGKAHTGRRKRARIGKMIVNDSKGVPPPGERGRQEKPASSPALEGKGIKKRGEKREGVKKNPRESVGGKVGEAIAFVKTKSL